MKTKNIQFPTFIGRTKEISKIDRHVDRWGGTVVVNIAGPGGIGKTAILRKIKEQYKAAPAILVTDIIDFSQTVHRSEAWILEQIVSVAPKQFPHYYRIMRNVQSATEPLTRLQQEGELVNAFLEDFSKIASRRRFVIFFDTLELIQDSPLFAFSLELAKRLQNTVLLLAGRRNDEKEFNAELERIFKPSQIKRIRLTGFSEKEAMQYFQETKTPHLKEVDPNLKKNIYFLSDGTPIKISLSLDWLDRGIPIMPDVMKLEPSRLRALPAKEIKSLRTQFESALMEGIRRFQSPVDEIILYMAHFNRRFNHKLLEFFFLSDLAPRQKARRSQQLLAELQELPFVKYANEDYFVLHDEMSRLVQSYVWDTFEDPERTLRKKLSERICDYYNEELNALPDWEVSTEQQRVTRRSYEVEALYYRLYADFRSGFREFEALFERLTADRRSGLAALILEFIQGFQTEPAFSEVMQYFLNGYYSGGVLIAREKFEEAAQKLEKGERQIREAFDSYDWKKAGPLDRYLYERRYLIYQQLGYCYRAMGDWKEAERNYQRALELAMELAGKVFEISETLERKKTFIQQIAEILNNLGNLYRLTGEFYEARLLCQTGFLLRQAWDLDTVMSLYVMSMILWEMGDTADSVVNLNKAEQMCTDDYRLALLKKYHAYILFRTGLTKEARPLLDEAEAILRQKIRRSELADALNIRCRMFRVDTDLVTGKVHQRSTMKYVEELGNEAYLLATQSNDKFRIAECHLTQAFHYYQWSQSERKNAAHYRQMALKQWEQGVSFARARYHQIYGLYCQLRGDIAFSAPKPEYKLAFEQYIEQCKVGTHFKQASYERGIDHLGDRLHSLSTTDPELALDFIDKITATWKNDPEVANRTELVDELQEVKRTIEEHEKLKDLQRKYNQARLEGKLEDARQYLDSIDEIPSLYTDADHAELLLGKSWVAHRQEHFGEARRYAKAALQLGYILNADKLMGNAHLSMTSILWDTTSTAEAAEHLKKAMQIFSKKNDPLGLAHARRFQNYILYRTGNFDHLLEKLHKVAEVFEKYQMNADVADLRNLMSRVARTNTVYSDLQLARKFAEEALLKAEESQDAYRKAECLLSLGVLSFREKKFEATLACYQDGILLLPLEAHAIRTVYEGIQGSAYFEKALQATGEERQNYFQRAFFSFSKELAEASQSKPATLARSLDWLFLKLLRLPSQQELTTYTQMMEQELKRLVESYPQLEKTLPNVERLLAQACEFYPFLQVNPVERDTKS